MSARSSVPSRLGATPSRPPARRTCADRRRAGRTGRCSSAAKSALDAMKPYAIAAMSRRRVASICPPHVVSHYCRRLHLHSDCRETRGPRGVPDPRPARGRRPRGAGRASAARSRAPCSRRCSSRRARSCPTDRLVDRGVGRRPAAPTPSARCAPTSPGCAAARSRSGCGAGRRATRSTSPTASSTPPSSHRLAGPPASAPRPATTRAARRPPRRRARRSGAATPLAEFDAADIDRDGGSRGWPTCALAAVEERAAALLALGRGRGGGRRARGAGRRGTRTGRRLAVLLMHALYAQRAAGRRAGRLPGPARAASSTSWASSRPDADAGAAPPGARRTTPRSRPSSDRRTATCRGAAPRWSAGTRRSTRSRPRCGSAPLVTLTGVGGVGQVPARDRGGRAGSATGSPTAPGSAELAPLADGGPSATPSPPRCGVQQRHGLTIEQTVVEYLARPVAAARAGQLRARAGRRRPAGPRIVAALPRRRRARHQPGAARRRRASRCGRCRRCPPPDAATLFVQRAAGHPPRLPTRPRQRGAVAEICRAARRAAAGHRAGRGPDAGDERRRGRRAARRRPPARPRPRARRSPATRASRRRSTGPTGCWPSRSSGCSPGCRCSRAAPTSPRVHAVCGEPGTRRGRHARPC